MSVLVAVPVKPFGVAKQRLAPLLDEGARSRLGKAVLRHTLAAAEATGARVAVVTADAGVARWTKAQGHEVIPESPEHGTGLDGAATAGVAAARRLGMRWAVVHGDLPLVEPEDLHAAFDLLPRRGILLAPSHDGGSSVVAGDVEAFRFRYGPGSFRRHLASVARSPHAVLVSPGLALDLDGPRDLAYLADHPRGTWIRSYLGS